MGGVHYRASFRASNTLDIAVEYQRNDRSGVSLQAILLAIGLCAAAAPAAAVDLGGLDGARPLNENYVEPEPWKEGATELPPYPDERDLLEVAVDDAGAGRTYYLDTKSLSMGEDRVVRYTVVIVSRTGARNVFYEGIRCDTREYKTYAYGTSGGDLRMVPESRWEPISGRGATVYRHYFYEYYVCDPQRFPLPPKQVIQRVKHPDQNFNFLSN